MDHQASNLKELDLSGLTDEQKRAIESLKQKISNARYFLSLWDYPPNKISEFRRVNAMKESDDPDERTRGLVYEQALMKQCGYEPR